MGAWEHGSMGEEPFDTETLGKITMVIPDTMCRDPESSRAVIARSDETDESDAAIPVFVIAPKAVNRRVRSAAG